MNDFVIKQIDLVVYSSKELAMGKPKMIVLMALGASVR
jgi:hypothetical protein